MNFAVLGIVFATTLSAAILVSIEIGRRIGRRRMQEEGEAATKGFGAVEGAVFALLGLVLAFTFSGALTRFDARRQLVVQEVNAVGTAWLRIDLVAPQHRAVLRDLFRRYLDARIEAYRHWDNPGDVRSGLASSIALQKDIWEQAVSSSQETGSSQAPMLLLAALNDMFDITTTRTEATRVHPPKVVFIMLGALTFACSLFAGYDMASRPKLNLLHSVAFAAVLSVTVYVIVDIEYPRMGLIRMTDSDQVMVDLRKSMD